MKFIHNKSKNIGKNMGKGILITLAVFFVLTLGMGACSDNSLGPKNKINGNVIKINADDLYTTNVFKKVRHKLAAKDGCGIIHALKKKAALLEEGELVSVAVKSLNSGADIPYLLHVKDDDGQIEKFVLVLTLWVPHPSQKSGKQIADNLDGCSANIATDKDAYLALDPDFFYLQDTDNGGDNLPITFPAESLTKSNKTIKITLDEDVSGKYMYHFSTGDGQLNLVYLTAVPIVG